MKIPRERHMDIIRAYTIDLLPMQEIADMHKVSRTAIHKILQAADVDTGKQRYAVSCTTCGQLIQRTRKQIRKQYNHFCNQTCYRSYLDAGKNEYIGHRHSQRIARSIVLKHFALQAEHIVHHEDRNEMNNRLDNLLVFACRGDHIRYHHYNRDQYVASTTRHGNKPLAAPIYNEVKPIWSGKAVFRGQSVTPMPF